MLSRGSFHDPVGLVRRMAWSHDRAAWSALAGAATTVAAIPMDRLLAEHERRLVDRAPETTMPLILIVGGARTGTTLLYQLSVEHLVASYLPNLSAAFPRSPLTATAALMRNWDRSVRGTQNYYGQTPGPRGPNEGFHVWNRWLGSDRYTPVPNLDESSAHEMRQFFGAWTAKFPRPFVNKNNRNTASIRMLSEALPTAVFIGVTREPFFAAQSLIRARRTVQGDEHIGWGLNSHNATTEAGSLAYLDDIAEQVHRSDTMLQEQLASLPPSRCQLVSYEEICDNPAEVLDRVAGLAPSSGSGTLSNLSPLRSTNRVWLSREHQHRLEDALSRFY